MATALTLRVGKTVDREAVYKWKRNGIPWCWRIHVDRLARENGKAVPHDFFDMGAEVEPPAKAG